jgi:hypothetical protein
MPPWKDELSAEQIADVVAYLGILRDSARRGEAVFKLNCMLVTAFTATATVALGDCLIHQQRT